MKTTLRIATLCAALIITLLPANLNAAELIVNGGFENATAFASWTVVNSPNPWNLWRVSTAGNGGGYTSVAPTTVVEGTRNAWNGMTDFTNNTQWQLYQAVTVPAGNAITVSWRDRYQINHTQFCPSGACQPKFYYVEITDNTGTTVIQTLHTQSTIGNVNQDTGWVSHSVSLGGVGGQTIRLRFRGTETVALSGPGQIEIDAVSINSFVPTAAESTIAGRVVDSLGKPVSRAAITVTDSSGASQTVLSGSFGYYSIPRLNAGETYTVEVAHKRYLFPDSPRVINLQDNLNELDFMASPSVERLTYFP